MEVAHLMVAFLEDIQVPVTSAAVAVVIVVAAWANTVPQSLVEMYTVGDPVVDHANVLE